MTQENKNGIIMSSTVLISSHKHEMFMATEVIWKCQWSRFKEPAQIILNDRARLLLFIMLASKNVSCYEGYNIIDLGGWAYVSSALLSGRV